VPQTVAQTGEAQPGVAGVQTSPKCYLVRVAPLAAHLVIEFIDINLELKQVL
jgi:hypothetical protein